MGVRMTGSTSWRSDGLDELEKMVKEGGREGGER